MIILVPIVAFTTLSPTYAGSWDLITSTASSKSISLEFVPELSIQSVAAIIVLALSWGLGYFGQPHIVTKFMGIREATDLNKSKIVGMAWQLIALTAASCVGLVGIAFFKDGLANPERIFIEMVKALFHPLAAGFVLCGVLAASMSTMDSMILVCGSVFSEDFYKHLFKKEATTKELLRATRFGVVLVSMLSLFFALNRNTTIQEAVHYAWTGPGCAFGPLVLMALYYKKANKYGAIAGVFTGGLIAGTWSMINGYITDYTIPAMIPGFFISLLSIYVVSRLSENPVLVSE
jgi:sodium/proline symporter